jgi:hypothetical protein
VLWCCMTSRVIKITKRRIRLRKFVEASKDFLRQKFDWVSRTSRSELSDRVIRIGKDSTRLRVSEYTVDGSSLHPDSTTRTNPSSTLCLIVPQNRAEVPERPFIEGYVADSRAQIWVVVHPLEVSDYWVQPPVTVHQDGTWAVQIYVGRPGWVDVGKRFEIMACAKPYSRME